jgi:uncharacterized protein
MPSIRILLAPGASGSVERLRPHAAALAANGHQVELVSLPRTKAERAVARYREALEAQAGPRAVIGGHSFGGRVASFLAAEPGVEVGGLVLFSYPLHPPGRSEAWDARTAHWPRIACPVLLLSGESDPFAKIGLLRSAVNRLASAELVTYPGVGHGLGKVLPDALARVDAFVRERT